MAGIARELKSISANEVAMALGWLAQEGRIHFRQKRGMWEAHLDGKKEAERVADLVCGP